MLEPLSTNVVTGFLELYGRSENELLDKNTLSAPGLFEGEKEFITFADSDYETDRPWAFEIKAEACALIVVDLQEVFVNPSSSMCIPEAYRQIPRVKALIEGCRGHGIPVFFTENSIAPDCAADFYEYWPPIAAGAIDEGGVKTKVYHGLRPLPGERIISLKHTYDSFAGTDLDYVLRSLGKKTVIICGTLTNFCCESTARAAYSLNYHVVFGSDVNATDNALAHEATIRTLRRGFARVMGHEELLRLLAEGDTAYLEARTARHGSGDSASCDTA